MALSKIDVANMLTGLVPNDNTIRRPNSKAIVINGSMAVAQRSTSVASITSSGYYTVDRIRLGISSLGTWTSTQESLTSGNAYINGFSNAFKIDCTTADGSPGASDSLTISQKFEGQDLQLLKKGTANAEKITVAFWIKATKTGTFIAELYDHDNTRSCSKAYTVSSSNTWEHKVVNFPADTTGALDNDNANSLTLFLWQGAGSNFTSGTLNTSWGSATNSNRAVGQVNNADSTSNNVHITGLQLEVGEYTSSTLPPFQHESFADNLKRCQRYFVKIETPSGSSLEMATNKVNPNNGNQSRGVYYLAVPLRAGATTTLTGSVKAGYLGGDYSLSDQGFSTVSPTYGSTTDRVNIVSTYMNQSSNNSQHSMMFVLQASSSLSLDAEL
tara:strand:+ start:1135 stop:2292 length:1158 start_codon:yes stop_codon:yes gene_type:complete